MSESIRLGASDFVPDGQSRCFLVRERRIAVFRRDGGLLAFDDLCPHSGAPLSDGWIEDGCLVCPWHEARFSLQDGSPVAGPSPGPVAVHNIREQDGEIFLEWPGEA